MDRQGRMEKENKTLGTERREKIKTLYNELLLLLLYWQYMIKYGLKTDKWA